MADGAYIALNGLRMRISELDRVAADLSNVSTAGYKGERTSTHGVERPTFDALMQKATDPTVGQRKIDLTAGEVTPTGRDLDFAIDGKGFFSIQTPSGVRYTRNGSFERSADGTLTTTDGMPVLASGSPLQVGTGELSVDADGTVRAGDTAAGTLDIVQADPNAVVTREGAARFNISVVQPDASPSVHNHALERSNVSVVDALAQMTALSRSFDALQRGLVSLESDVDGRAITELGRR